MIRFSNYMNEWLYGSEGYYRHLRPIGKNGDYYTAVSTSKFFGASIANNYYKMLKQGLADPHGWLIEIGAHQGYLICDMIQWLYTCDPSLISTLKFGIVERQPRVREAQRAYIKERFGDDIEITHFDDISEVKVPYAFFVANEIFDAFPCELIKDQKMAMVEDHKIVWQEAPEVMLQCAGKYHQHTGEIAVGYESFAKAMAEGAESCDFVTFDYGENYVRNDFSIRLYRGHETFPLFDESIALKNLFAKSDITYDVNFAHVIDAFENAGFKTVEYETQARALIRFGLIDILEKYSMYASRENYLREADKIKTLIAPNIMGERFKMLHLKR